MVMGKLKTFKVNAEDFKKLTFKIILLKCYCGYCK